MNIKYGSYENVVKAHDAGIAYGGIVSYVHNSDGFGIIQHGIAKDTVSANKVANILREMAQKERNSPRITSGAIGL